MQLNVAILDGTRHGVAEVCAWSIAVSSAVTKPASGRIINAHMVHLLVQSRIMAASSQLGITYLGTFRK